MLAAGSRETVSFSKPSSGKTCDLEVTVPGGSVASPLTVVDHVLRIKPLPKTKRDHVIRLDSVTAAMLRG